MKVLVWYSGNYADPQIAFSPRDLELGTVPHMGERIVMDNGRTYYVDAVVWYPFAAENHPKVAVNVKDLSEGD